MGPGGPGREEVGKILWGRLKTLASQFRWGPSVWGQLDCLLRLPVGDIRQHIAAQRYLTIIALCEENKELGQCFVASTQQVREDMDVIWATRFQTRQSVIRNLAGHDPRIVSFARNGRDSRRWSALFSVNCATTEAARLI